MISLNSNGRCEIKKFNNKNDICTYICNNNSFYYCDGGYFIGEIDKNNSCIDSYISKYFDVEDPKIFTGSCYPDKFTTKRVIIIEMK
jgi:hypothetical protein